MWWMVGAVALIVVLWAARRLINGVPLHRRGTRGGRRAVRSKDAATLAASHAAWVDGPPGSESPPGGYGGGLG